MRKFIASLKGAILTSFVLLSSAACTRSVGPTAASTTPNAADSPTPPSVELPQSDRQKTVKPDFTMTAGELIGEFTRIGAETKDLTKYAGKSVSVVGTVKMFSFEPNGTAPPYIVLGTPGTERGVVYYHDNADVGGGGSR